MREVGGAALGDSEIVEQDRDASLHCAIRGQALAGLAAARPDLGDDGTKLWRLLDQPLLTQNAGDDRLDGRGQPCRALPIPPLCNSATQ